LWRRDSGIAVLQGTVDGVDFRAVRIARRKPAIPGLIGPTQR
jgi:hypothetical protein